jgi:glycosyltransferase involved in cell wall biosynthesis
MRDLSRIPAISIITPVLNGEKYIAKTIDSVLEMSSGFNVEYIVIDDGSSDATPQILQTYGDQLNVITQSNSGESLAVNAGIFAASGKVCLVVSADDPLFTRRIFEDVEDSFEKDPNLMCLYCDWRIIDDKGDLIRSVIVSEFSHALLIGENSVLPGPGAFFRTSAAKAIGGRNPERVFTGDFDFWLRLSTRGDFKRRPYELAQWRSHQDSTSIKHRGLNMALERISVIEDFLSTNSIESKLARDARASAYYLASRLAFFDPRIPGKTFLLKSFYFGRGAPAMFRLKEALFILTTPVSYHSIRLLQKFNRMVSN